MGYVVNISLIILKVQHKYCDRQAARFPVLKTPEVFKLNYKTQVQLLIYSFLGAKNTLCFHRAAADYSEFPITYKMLYFQVLPFFSLGIYAKLRGGLCFFYFRRNGSLVSKNKPSKKQRWEKLCCSML